MSNEMDRAHSHGAWAVRAAVATAVLASAYCLLPRILGGLGVTVVSVAAMFESVRPYFLALTGVLVGLCAGSARGGGVALG